MHGARRVVVFCLLTAVLPTILLVIPLYLRHSVYADVVYAVAESDVIEIVDGISSIFCQAHSLKMNTTFHAFQLPGTPKLSTNRKHIRLKKSMSLPDDTLEYWGFYLLKGSLVELSICSRYAGSRIMVVKGEKNLHTCGIMDHSHKPEAIQPQRTKSDGHVRVTFETEAQEIHSKEPEHVQDRHQNVDEQYEGEEEDTKLRDSPQGNKHDLEAEDITTVALFAEQYLKKHSSLNKTASNETASYEKLEEIPRHFRHSRRKLAQLERHNLELNKRIEKRHSLERSLNVALHADMNILKKDSVDQRKNKTKTNSRQKRQFNPLHLLDGGIGHGGNAANFTEKDNEESSASSFEKSLFTCYGGQILFVKSFSPSHLCTDVHILEKHGKSMQTVHEVDSDGYYYYIFYSDNDFVQNDIHALFDIFKPTYQYTKFTRGCINKTECTFPVSFLSEEIVIVEVPTRDGIEHEESDISYLISSCYPRMSVYIIFPISVLFLVLGCAFL